MKRDMEELRKDVECSPHVHAVSAMAAAGQTHMAAAVAASLAARTMSPPEHAAMAAAMAASAARYDAVTCEGCCYIYVLSIGSAAVCLPVSKRLHERLIPRSLYPTHVT